VAIPAVSVVVVDDDDDIRALLVRGIERHPELTVVGEAGDFDTATELIATTQPRVALIDRSMPVAPTVAGLQLLRERAAATVLILLSAYPTEALEADLRGAVDLCLEKSTRLNVLLDAIVAAASVG
jgi:DNA-binding NarL/FixJ family response regulator